MNYGVHNNLMFMNANSNMRISTGKRAKSAEKLSSGYRINRAADDVAGLTISEKMRWQIRGLNRGIRNGEDAISWVQTGDGALDEVQEMIHRMRELAIQSLNDTNTDADRAACQEEFDALQSEIDRIARTTQFNAQNIFEDHELPYYQCEGSIQWMQSQPHVIGSDNNDMVIYYRNKETDTQETVAFSVPAGTYTTQELIDEIDDAIIAAGLDKKGIMFEFTEEGICNLNLEGGEVIDAVGGGLSYLLYDMYNGGSFGALIGTTTFVSEYARLEIKTGQNDELTFSTESFDGLPAQTINLTIPEGRYTRNELIDFLNQNLQGTEVTATAYGSGIKLAGKNCIVTGFKGNMFKIDEGRDIYHSVFYDNVKYGTVGNMKAACFKGGAVKSTDALSAEHSKFEIISGNNNQLIIGANGGALETLTIPDGSYTVDEMITKLNELFTDKNLELEATTYTSGNYKGIQITSKEKGISSKIEIDSNCSAYKTLFVERSYNTIVENPVVYKDTKSDSVASVTGAKVFGTSNLPLTVVNGQNDTFTLKLNGTGTDTYEIKLSEKTYNTLDEIITEINTQLVRNGIDGKVEVKANSSKVQFVAKNGSGLTGVTVARSGNNTGYDDIFVKTTVTYIEKTLTNTGTKPTITLTESFGNTTQFDSSNNTLTVNVNGGNKTVTFATDKTYSQQDILDEINKQLKSEMVTGNNTFTTINGRGTTISNNFANNGTGSTSYIPKSYSNTGSSNEIQGSVGNIENNTPAKITMTQAVSSKMSIDSSCNTFYITINGIKKQLTLDTGVYTQTALQKQLQSKIDEAFGTTCGGAEVSINNGQMVFTARLNNPDGSLEAGKNTSISCTTEESSFLKKLHTTETSAAMTTKNDLQSTITITNDKNTFCFKYTDAKGQSYDVTLNLTAGSYSRQQFVDQLNTQLSGYGVTAKLSGNKLFLTTMDVGGNTSVSFSTSTGGTAVEAIFGEMITNTPASGTANCDLQDTIVIDNDSQEFNVKVNGQTVSVNLQNGTYNRADFVTMLNTQLSGKGLKAQLDATGKRITYTTDAVGSNAAFTVDYASGGTAMKAMYGESTGITPGVTAEFQNGKLVLTGTQSGTLKMTSSPGSLFLKSTASISTASPTTVTGYSSTKYAYIDGASIQEPVEINALNNKLKFTYVDGVGNNKTAEIILEEKTYTFDELKTALQNKIDSSAIGADELEVFVTADGVRIQAKEAGSTHYMKDFSGGFYQRVLQSVKKNVSNLSVSNSSGSQTNDPAYTIGRKDVNNSNTVIRKGFNDTLKLDFHYGSKMDTYTLKLEAGEYSPGELIRALQNKLDEQLVAAGFEEGTIEVGIGGVHSGVSGSNDDDALVFKLSENVKLSEMGTYIIDGVSGNAAFSIFYQTDGELKFAYICGSKNVTNGVTIKPGENQLSFKVDQGDSYTITLEEKDYTEEELIDELNKKLEAVNAPVAAEMHNDKVRLVYTMLGEHRIYEVSGSAKTEIFFEEHGESGEMLGRKIQLSSNVNDSLELEKNILNTLYLGINSITISRPKYADKALMRLDEALNKVSSVRGTFGITQNRLEHAIANNENAAENTQSAESKLRDADMADEMVNYSKHNILVQAGNAVMAQGKISAESVIKLLQM